MKLTAFFIALFAFQVAAKVSGQTVSLSMKNAPFMKVIEEIGRQTRYDFSYSDEILKRAKPVSVELINVPIEIALKDIFSKQPLTYEIADKIIIVKERVASPVPLPNTRSRQNISGQVLDISAKPLENVTVIVKGTSKETFTDAGGMYALSNVNENAILQFRLIGYETLEVPANKTVINVILNAATTQLAEVTINKGYYTTSKELNTGSVSTVNAKVLESQPVANPLMALMGRVPGLYINQTSGVSGTGMEVRLRGMNSIANGNNPLYIVDGVPFTSESLMLQSAGGIAISPFSAIRPQDIERIDVLKDADATAIYGSRGANGVILITTKKADGRKTGFSATLNRGVGKIGNRLKLMNTGQYLSMRAEAFKNDGLQPGTNDFDINGTYDPSRYTDWQDVMIGGTAQLTDVQASLSGGNQQTSFLLSGAYRNETTVFPGPYRDRQASVLSNVRHQSANGRFQADFNISFLNDNNRLPLSDFTDFISLAPNAPVIYNSDGTLNWANSTWNNPFGNLKAKSTSVSRNLNGALNLRYHILDGLNLQTRVGYNHISMETSNQVPFTSQNPTLANPASFRRNNYGENKLQTAILEPSVSYQAKVAKGQLDAILGTTFQQNMQNGMAINTSGYSSDALIGNLNAATTASIFRTINLQYLYNAIFARVGYTFMERYVLNVTGRRDGSSRFGPGKQFGNFGAIGAAWIFSKESFVENSVPFLSLGKLRGSIGLTGNDQLGDYKYLSTYEPTGTSYQEIAGLRPTQHTNPRYGWETVKKLELALELGFLENRIMFNTNVYRNRTGNQLVGYALPAMTGFTTVQANLPAVVQNTGLEFDLDAAVIQKQSFRWQVSANLSFPRNKLVTYPNIQASSYRTRYAIGEPLFVRFLYHYTGIDAQKGVYTFEDFSGDGAVTSALDRKPVFVGQNFFGGLNNSFQYKGFQMDVFLQFVKQNGLDGEFFSSTPGTFFTSAGTNQPASVLNHWKASGDQTRYQKFSQNFSGDALRAYSPFLQSDGIVTDASFIRLKNVMLAYNLPQQFTGHIGLAGLKVFMQGQNLFTITKYKGFDPETSGNSVIKLPPLRMLTMGVQLSIN